MILIQFPDRETEITGLAALMSRFSGKVLRGGLHIVPEPALEALTAKQIAYTVKGPATYVVHTETDCPSIRRSMSVNRGGPRAGSLDDGPAGVP